mmetsp:Transcript_4473/g.8722  ORF Transcript_4473/g.8722 Transcript_4473/m.8722 type:complete len:196 (-) Transcript_4473:429-1016(-)|eukprot:CAMPEP_0167794258 /NCGR_PEP_ID=MMETSP0111_2-20121227/13699_1 /TAXON_ID=91324 /ORGANISM="Lotharella globosa, Strain CCCM811" /LENGTH=195 /DNA_ID=CAMNT_0007687633 /DNA_START=1 /DNA_END=588 /DNA_ORIENTATION=-
MDGKSGTMRIVVLGSGAVGKSSLTMRLTTGKFFDDYDPTIEDCHVKTLVVDDRPVRLEILDTAGQDIYQNSFLEQWIDSAQGFILVYAIDSVHTLELLHGLRDRILLSKDDERVPIVLVGNKSDLESKRMVETSAGKGLADRWGCKFFETSAKAAKDHAEPFAQLVREIRQRNEGQQPKAEPAKRSFWQRFCVLL